MATIPTIHLTNTENSVTYLADGVYASFDGYQVKLMTDNHINPTNVIYMNEDTLEALYAYVERLNRQVQDE